MKYKNKPHRLFKKNFIFPLYGPDSLFTQYILIAVFPPSNLPSSSIQLLPSGSTPLCLSLQKNRLLRGSNQT